MMAAVAIAIVHIPCQRKKAYSLAEQCLTNHLSRIGVLNGKKGDNTGCVLGGRKDYAIILSFFLIFIWFFVAIQAGFHLVGVI